MELFSAIFDFLTANLETILQIVGGFAVLAAATPNQSDDKLANGVLYLINLFGGNVGRARNDPGA